MFTLRFLLALVVIGAIPAFADLSPVGAPRSVGSWQMDWSYSHSNTFDRMKVEMRSDGITFSTELGNGFDIVGSGWGGSVSTDGWRSATVSRSAGSGAVTEEFFTLNFSSSETDPVRFRFAAYRGGLSLEAYEVYWPGVSGTGNLETGNLWSMERCSVPEPSTVVLRGGWLLALGALIARRTRFGRRGLWARDEGIRH